MSALDVRNGMYLRSLRQVSPRGMHAPGDLATLPFDAAALVAAIAQPNGKLGEP
jgi:hypothetical protein